MMKKIKKWVKKSLFLSSIFYKFRNINNKRKKKKNQKLLAKYGTSMSHKIADILNGSSIQYFYAYGSLLGLIRDGKFMDHDDDMDIGILNTERDIFSKLDSLMERNGFKKIHAFYLHGQIKEVAYIWNKLKVDFFLYEDDKSGKMSSYSFFKKQGVEYKQASDFFVAKLLCHKITGVKQLTINGFNYNIPQNAEIYLADIYGDTWRYPNPNWKNEDCPARNELHGIMGEYIKFH